MSIISGSTVLNLDLFKDLDAEIGPQLSSLASEIGEQYSKTIAQYVNFIFVTPYWYKSGDITLKNEILILSIKIRDS